MAQQQPTQSLPFSVNSRIPVVSKLEDDISVLSSLLWELNECESTGSSYSQDLNAKFECCRDLFDAAGVGITRTCQCEVLDRLLHTNGERWQAIGGNVDDQNTGQPIKVLLLHTFANPQSLGFPGLSVANTILLPVHHSHQL